MSPWMPHTPPPSPPVPSWSQLELQNEELQPRQPPLPPLTHTLHQKESSVISLAADEKWVFSGSQGMDIFVWDRDTFQVAALLQGHTGSVLSLEVSTAKHWLLSSSGDSTVRIWNTITLSPLYVLTPFTDYNAGDIFSLGFSETAETVFFGCQNTSLQWFDFSRGSKDWKANASNDAPDIGGQMTPNFMTSRRPHKFFDSEPQPAGRPSSTPLRGIPSPGVTPSSTLKPLPGLSTPNTSLAPPSDGRLTPLQDQQVEPRVLSIPSDNWIPSAHFGYIYCMALVPPSTANVDVGQNQSGPAVVRLVTGSGDEEVKLWSYEALPSDSSSNMILLHSFYAGSGVMSIIVRKGNIYAGCQDGYVKVWDIDTKTLVRTIIIKEGADVLSVSMVGSELYTCLANGYVQRYSSSFDPTGCWKAHNGTALSSITVPSGKESGNDWYSLITGASDNNIKLWTVASSQKECKPTSLSSKCIPSHEDGSANIEFGSKDTMLHALAQFVSFPSVSNSESHREDCRQTAIWLKKCLTQFGAESQLLYGVEGRNPAVLSTFTGTKGPNTKPRILFYGHYDVIASGSPSSWDHEPYMLTGFNGYLYGRGVSDNKGPVLAVACAASEMLARRSLECDLVLLIEGEEEAGSGGFTEAVQKYKDQIGHIDAILISNSYWIDDHRPCITYGLRGVVHTTVEIQREGADVHSGVDGGCQEEPMMDMIKLLAKLQDGSKVSIPGFYEHVRPPLEEEDGSFQVLSDVTGHSPRYFASRWREPSLTVHGLSDSGLGNSTIIPARVRAKFSVRIVPDQDLETIISSIESYIQTSFAELHSPNSLKFTVDRAADWWIGSFSHRWFKALEGAIYDEWGVQPLRIREGGSIPSVPFLEKQFGCPAFHLPMGQSSDSAHLRNERISLNNLRKGKAVIERFLTSVAAASE